MLCSHTTQAYTEAPVNGGFGNSGDVHLLGIPWANLSRIWDNVTFNPILANLENSLVVLQIGGNDLDAINVHSIELAREILGLA